MDDSGDSTGVGTIIGFLFMLGLFAVFIYAIYWIYNDAGRNRISVFNKPYQPDDPKTWVFICVVCFILGVPYYIHRRATTLTPSIPAGKISAEEELKEAASLKEKGLITEAEFDQKRRKILGL